MLKNKASIVYTLKHKKEFLRVEKELLGRNTLSGYLHDLDKVIMYLFLDKETAHNLHVKFAKHHNKARKEKDFIQMVIDWECARFTKPDKPLNAFETLFKFYPNLVNTIMPILIRFNLNSPRIMEG